MKIPILETVVIISIVFVLVSVNHNGKKHKEYIDAFELKCEGKGGVMKLPKGVKGWPQPECVNPESIIKIEEVNKK